MSGHNNGLYDSNERQKIIDHIIQKNLYFNLRKRCVWQEMEKLEICPGRTWQSMKQYFQNHIIYFLDKVNINETEKNKILNCYHNNYKRIPVKRKKISSTSSNETDNDYNAPKKCKVQSLSYKVQKSPKNTSNYRDNCNRTTHENINNEKMESKENRDVGENMMDKLNNLSFTNDDNAKNACGTEVDSSTEDSYSEEEDLRIIIYIKENMNWTNLQYFDGIYNDCQRVLINRSATSIKKRFINEILPNIYKYRIVDIDEIPLFYDRAYVDMPNNFEQILKDYMKNNGTSSVESISTSTKSYEKSASKILHESNKDALLHHNEKNDVQLQTNENTHFPVGKSVMRNSELVSENNELSCAKNSSKMLHEGSNKEALLHHNEKIDIQLQTNDNTHSPIQNSKIVSENNELSCNKSSSKMLYKENNKDALLRHNEKIDVQLQINENTPIQKSLMRNNETVSGHNKLSYVKSFNKMLRKESNKDGLLHHNKKIDVQLQTNENSPIQKSVMRNSEIDSGNNEINCDKSSSEILHEESNKDAWLHHNEKIDVQLQTNADFKSQTKLLPGGLLNLRPPNFKKIETLQSDSSCELLRSVKNKSSVVHLPLNVEHIKDNKYLEKICNCTKIKSNRKKKSNKKKNCRKLDAPEESNKLESTANYKQNRKSANTSSNDNELNSTNYMEDADLSKNIFCENIDDITAEIEIDSILNHSSPIISMSRRNKIKPVNIDKLLSTEIKLCNKLTSDDHILVNAHLNSIQSRSCSPSIKEDCEEVCDKLNGPCKCIKDNVKRKPNPENKIDIAEDISFIANLPKLPENLKEQTISLNKVDYWDNNSFVKSAENNNSSLSLYVLNSNKRNLLPELTSRLVNEDIDYNVEENNFEPYSPKQVQKSKASNSEVLITVKDELIFNNVVDGVGRNFPVLCNEILEEKFNPDEEIKNEISDSSLVSYNEDDYKEETVSDLDEEIKNEISDSSPVSYNEDDCKEDTVSDLDEEVKNEISDSSLLFYNEDDCKEETDQDQYEKIKNESSNFSPVSYNEDDCKEEETGSEECITLNNEENEECNPGKLYNENFTCLEDLLYQQLEDSIEEHFGDGKHNKDSSPELLDKVECFSEEEQIKIEYENLSENYIDDVIENANNSHSISMKEIHPYRTQNCLEETELFKEKLFEECEPKNSIEIKMEEEEIDINILFADTEILMQIKLEEDPLNIDNYEEQNDFDVKIKTEDGDLHVKMEENSIYNDHSYVSVFNYSTRKTYKNNMLSSKNSKKSLEEENVKYTNFLLSNVLACCHISTNCLKNIDLDVDTSINDVTLSLNFEENLSLEFNIPDLREIRLSS